MNSSSKKFKDMLPEEKMQVYERTERYRKKNMQLYATAANKYYHTHKEECAERARQWREKNKDYVKIRQRLDKRKRKLEAIKYLGGVCAICNLKHHPAVFEFHHIDATSKGDRDPSKFLSLKWERVTEELDKCILLCANCHRLTHHGGEDW